MANQLLKGKKGIIFGALDEKSIAWKTALACYEAGASIVLTNAPVALRMGEINKLSALCGNAPVIGADVTNMDDLKHLFEQSMQHFGGKIDFVLHSIGMSLNVRKGKHYTEMNYEWNSKTLDISAMSFHRVLRTAWDLDALNEWSSVVALTYIAEKMSPLGNASAEDCANYILVMFSDLTRMVTMQNLFHDGGFSFTGVTGDVIEQMEK